MQKQQTETPDDEEMNEVYQAGYADGYEGCRSTPPAHPALRDAYLEGYKAGSRTAEGQ